MGDDLNDSTLPSIALPDPDLGTLAEVEVAIRNAGNTAQGRDALAKYITSEGFIGKLLPLLEVAEDLESLTDLHRLCNILKLIILLNDNLIIEYLVMDDAIMNVVGILECASFGRCSILWSLANNTTR
jgi:protein phosphatase 4 regulatory subunit 3